MRTQTLYLKAKLPAHLKHESATVINKTCLRHVSAFQVNQATDDALDLPSSSGVSLLESHSGTAPSLADFEVIEVSSKS